MERLRKYLQDVDAANACFSPSAPSVAAVALKMLKDVEDIHKEANSILAETCVQCEEEVTALKDKIRVWSEMMMTNCDECDVDDDTRKLICPCDQREVYDEMKEVIQ